MGFFWLALIAGILTVLAPCILPLLPIVIGRSAQDGHRWRPYIVSASLGVAVIVFTLLLKASTALISIPQHTWSFISGTIIIFFGIISLFPEIWERLGILLGISSSSNRLLQKVGGKNGAWGDVLLGLALGPVFTSCSPTYFLILATVLPQHFLTGTLYLAVYAAGLSGTLLLIGLLGQRLVKKLNLLSNPKGWFKRLLGVLFILVGIFIMSGLDKKIQTAVLDNGYFDITKVEQYILQKNDMNNEADKAERSLSEVMSKEQYPLYSEIVDPSGFINSEPFKMEDLVGKKVILLDFMTYSCINCQRTFPYLNAWYDKYKDDGLEIIGIHTPEFAFEKIESNVSAAAKDFGLEFPIVLDNNYATWGAYGNRYWPRKYLIDIDGHIVYDHIGEGAYDETEKMIQKLLEERAVRLGDEMPTTSGIVSPSNAESVNFSGIQSRETYLGSYRNKDVGIVASVNGNLVTFSKPKTIEPNRVYLVGTWNITGEYAEAVSEEAALLYKFTAQKVFLVMGANTPTQVKVLKAGVMVTDATGAGSSVENGSVTVDEEMLYRLIEEDSVKTEMLELRVEAGTQLFAFTFG